MFTFINHIILIILLILSILFDVMKRKIPNFLTFPVILSAMITSIIFGGLNGILFSLAGFLVGMLVFLLPFAMGGMGAGDVKLMGAIGSLMGWRFVLKTALLTGIVGGILALGYVVFAGKLLQTLKNVVGTLLKPILRLLLMRTESDRVLKIYNYVNQDGNSYTKTYLPYGLAIGIGTIMALSGKFEGLVPF